MFEKLCVIRLGWVLSCLFVKLARSIAIINPVIETAKALSFSV